MLSYTLDLPLFICYSCKSPFYGIRKDNSRFIFPTDDVINMFQIKKEVCIYNSTVTDLSTGLRGP